MLDDILYDDGIKPAHADLIAAVADTDHMQSQPGESAERGGPPVDVKPPHIARVSVTRRPDALNVDDGVDAMMIDKSAHRVNPLVEVLRIRRRDGHMVFGQSRRGPCADDRLARLIADQPGIRTDGP